MSDRHEWEPDWEPGEAEKTLFLAAVAVGVVLASALWYWWPV